MSQPTSGVEQDLLQLRQQLSDLRQRHQHDMDTLKTEFDSMQRAYALKIQYAKSRFASDCETLKQTIHCMLVRSRPESDS